MLLHFKYFEQKLNFIRQYATNQMQNIYMFMSKLIKKLVAGPKRMVTFEDKTLDLTYISQRLIAMAFPATEKIEKLYRNHIQDIANYLQTQHPDNYLVLNVSNRLYDYSVFKYRVKDFKWPDHQAPALTTLIQIGFEMYHFLRSHKNGVIAIHCNHGKGRTGTGIISFMILIGYLHSAQICLKLYNSKRFSTSTYGVDQPCQKRYLNYIQQLTRAKKINEKLAFYRLKKVSFTGGLTQKYFVRITQTRSEEVILDKIMLNQDIAVPMSTNMLYGDIFIELFSFGLISMIKERVKISRINCNLYFIDKNTLNLTFNSKDIKLEYSKMEDFSITLHFQYFCLCHLKPYHDSTCKCKITRKAQQLFWKQMIEQIQECKKMSVEQVRFLIHGEEPYFQSLFKDDKQSVLQAPPQSRSQRKRNRSLTPSRQQKIFKKQGSHRYQRQQSQYFKQQILKQQQEQQRIKAQKEEKRRQIKKMLLHRSTVDTQLLKQL